VKKGNRSEKRCERDVKECERGVKEDAKEECGVKEI
jgi:hypothetical protein